jgi:hypothetical protein
MAQCKGFLFTARLKYVQEKHGPEGSRRLHEQLAPQTQALIERHALPHEWVPFAAFIDVNVVADRLFGKGDLALCREMGAWSAEANLPRVFRFFYRFGSPMFLFERAAKLWGGHYDSGRMETMRDQDGAAHLVIYDFGEPHRAHCLSVLGWCVRSIEMSGAKVHSAAEQRCRLRGDECCEFVAHWT